MISLFFRCNVLIICMTSIAHLVNFAAYCKVILYIYTVVG